MEKEIEKNEHNKESATDRVTIKTWLCNKEFNNSCKNLINFVSQKKNDMYTYARKNFIYLSTLYLNLVHFYINVFSLLF